jgi:3-deoxy-D-manno-octulosonate 8-phosphate phosphatase (KDO 8-P phosphatase)
MMAQDHSQAERIRDLRFVAFDFDGVFTDNAVWISDSGQELVRCSRLDGIGLERLRRLGIGMAVVSTEVNPVVRMRCDKLKIDCVQGCEDKAAAVRELVAAFGAAVEQAAFVGNDVNDLAALELVGLPVVVADAHPAVKRPEYLQTTVPGGRGAVREFCDLVCRMREGAPSRV